MEDIERIRRAYFINGLSIREIGRRYGQCRRTVRKAIQDPGPSGYQLGNQGLHRSWARGKSGSSSCCLYILLWIS